MGKSPTVGFFPAEEKALFSFFFLLQHQGPQHRPEASHKLVLSWCKCQCETMVFRALGDCKCPARPGAGSGSAGLGGNRRLATTSRGGIKDTGTQKRQPWATRGFCLQPAVFPVGLARPGPSPILPKSHPPGQELSDSVVTSSPLGRMGTQKVLFLPLMSRPPCPVVAGPPGSSSISSPGRAGRGHRTTAPSMSDRGQFPGHGEATTGRLSFKNLPRGALKRSHMSTPLPRSPPHPVSFCPQRPLPNIVKTGSRFSESNPWF